MAVGLESGNILIFTAEGPSEWTLRHDLGETASHTGTVTRVRFQPCSDVATAAGAPLLVRPCDEGKAGFFFLFFLLAWKRSDAVPPCSLPAGLLRRRRVCPHPLHRAVTVFIKDTE